MVRPELRPGIRYLTFDALTPRFAFIQMFIICFLLLPLCKHNACAATQGNISNNLGGTSYGESVDSGVSTTPVINDRYASKISNEESQINQNGFNNWTREDLTYLLNKHGYLVKKDSEGWPLGMMGDVAYYPEDLLPEMGILQNRRNLAATKRLWVDGDKETIVPYYYDTSTRADQKVFEAAVKSWSDNTCIKFARQPPNHCKADLGHAAVCVGDFGGCFSLVGKRYSPQRRQSQKMSVNPGGCELFAAAHEFGHALGFRHEMARADRDKHIHVLYRNINLDLNKLRDTDIKHSWYQASRCNEDQMYDAPKPYDPMSLMQYGGSDFAEQDQLPVYLHKNPHYQYMFDYHRQAGYLQTHYDNLVVNLGYNCIQKWKKNCEASGVSVPKCQNYGYVRKDCKCACPNGFSGSTCGTKEGPLFPVMDRAKVMLDITEPGLVDLKGKGMHEQNNNYPISGFNRWQFITVTIRSGSKTRINVGVAQNFESLQENLARSKDFLMEDGNHVCRYGVHVYVGDAEAGKMRTECISSMVNNEPKEYRTVLRSKTNALDIIGIGGWATCYYGGPKVTRLAMEFQFTVTFLDRPEDHLATEGEKPGKTDGKTDGTVNDVFKKAKKVIKEAVEGNKTLIIIGGVIVGLLLLGGAAGGGYWWYRKSKMSGDDDSSAEGEKEEEHSSDGGTSDDSSASGEKEEKKHSSDGGTSDSSD